jgi:hypothetical protein
MPLIPIYSIIENRRPTVDDTIYEDEKIEIGTPWLHRGVGTVHYLVSVKDGKAKWVDYYEELEELNKS